MLKKWFNLKFQSSIEIIYSFVPYFYRSYFMHYKNIPTNELKCLQEKVDISTIEKIVLVGGGAIPYTAIFFNKIINPKTFIIIEKDKLSSLAASRLLKRLNLYNFKVINMPGQDYSEYDNSLVIVALQVIGKQKIVNRILDRCYNNALIVRQPLRKNTRMFESISSNSSNYMTIEQKPDFESKVLIE